MVAVVHSPCGETPPPGDELAWKDVGPLEAEAGVRISLSVGVLLSYDGPAQSLESLPLVLRREHESDQSLGQGSHGLTDATRRSTLRPDDILHISSSQHESYTVELYRVCSGLVERVPSKSD